MNNKQEKIEELIEDLVNPALADHGGFVKLVEMIEDDAYTIIKLDFKGACNGCPSSVSDTLTGIQNLLREETENNYLIVQNSRA